LFPPSQRDGSGHEVAVVGRLVRAIDDDSVEDKLSRLQAKLVHTADGKPGGNA
jgi:hypothetical protein